MRIPLFELGVRLAQAKKTCLVTVPNYYPEIPANLQSWTLNRLIHSVSSPRTNLMTEQDRDRVVEQINRLIAACNDVHDFTTVNLRNSLLINIELTIRISIAVWLADSHLESWFKLGLLIADAEGSRPLYQQNFRGKNETTPRHGISKPASWKPRYPDEVGHLLSSLGLNADSFEISYNSLSDREFEQFSIVPDSLWGWLCIEKIIARLFREHIDLFVRFPKSNKEPALVYFEGQPISVSFSVGRFIYGLIKNNGEWMNSETLKDQNGLPDEFRIDRELKELNDILRNLIESKRGKGYRLRIRPLNDS